MAALTAVDEGTHHLRAVAPSAAPDLTVVPRRRRWPMIIAGFVVLLVLAAMLGAAVFHTQLAERQLEIDALGAAVESEHERYIQLRSEISAALDPSSLQVAAEQRGLRRAPQTRYLDVDRWALAIQLAMAGPSTGGDGRVIVAADPLEQYREIKALSAAQP